MAITAAQVKELREKTGAGMMDCKKALTECEGDIAKAVDWLREKGIAKSAKKEGRIAAEGLTRVAVSGNTAVLFEVNSETDFVSKNEQFLGLMDTLQEAILANKPATTAEIDPPMCMYEPKISSSAFSTTATRRKEIFSPIVAVALIIKSLIVPSAVWMFKASSVEAGLFARIASCKVFIKPKNCSFLLTKSVSELTSNNTAVFPLTATRVKPSAAIRPSFLAKELKEVQKLGVELAIVVGGGNFIRGKMMAELLMH